MPYRKTYCIPCLRWIGRTARASKFEGKMADRYLGHLWWASTLRHHGHPTKPHASTTAAKTARSARGSKSICNSTVRVAPLLCVHLDLGSCLLDCCRPLSVMAFSRSRHRGKFVRKSIGQRLDNFALVGKSLKGESPGIATVTLSLHGGKSGEPLWRSVELGK